MSQQSTETGKGRSPRRKRVVLAGSRSPVTVLRTVVELEEQTSYGEELVRGFVRVQLRTSLALAALTALLLCGWPVIFYAVPELSQVTVVGVRLPWLILGITPFPLLFAIGYWYNWLADHHERAFVEMVEK